MSKGMIFFIGCIFGIVVNELYHRYTDEENTTDKDTTKDETITPDEQKSYKDTVRNLHYSSEPTVPLNAIITNKKGEKIDRDGNHIKVEKKTIVSDKGIETEVEVRSFMRNENGDIIKEDDGMTPLEREIEYSEKINAMLAARPPYELIDENAAQEDINLYGYDRFICTYYAGNNVLFNDDDDCLLLMIWAMRLTRLLFVILLVKIFMISSFLKKSMKEVGTQWQTMKSEK